MKTKIALAFVVILLISCTAAFASNGVHMGPGYDEFADECAACHRAHTAGKARLIHTDATTMYGFCTSCHNGTGANTNVVSGVFEGTVTNWGTAGDGIHGAGLNAGGFESAMNYTGLTNRTSGPVALSGDGQRHNATGSDDAIHTAWGGGVVGPGTSMNLTCTSCHDPHGTDNGTGLPAEVSERYRILRNTVNGTPVTNLILSNEATGTHDYTSLRYKNGLASFCVACHTQYRNMSSFYNAGDGNGFQVRYRHNPEVVLRNGDPWVKSPPFGTETDMAYNMNNYTAILPTQQASYRTYNTRDDVMTCLTCHQVHGSAATASATQMNDATPAHSSTLLRLDNQGVCEACHMK